MSTVPSEHADIHRPETVTALRGACAQEACGHSGNPGDECPWEQIQVCTACSYAGVDLADVDTVPVTPWPCSLAPLPAVPDGAS